MPANIESDIDRLYQLPAGEFTAARNALAKTAGKNAAGVRQLAKPSIAAWAVNQLYWKRRSDYDALVEASTSLRKIHKAILGGHRGDIRDATKAHDAAIERALKSTLALLREEGHPVTDATRQAIQTTLRALPGTDAPGRLTQALQPGGFEMLSGLSVAPPRAGDPRSKAEPARKDARPPDKTDKTEKKDKKAQEAAARAARELRLAEHEAQRQEFEAAKTAREAEKAARAVEQAREAVEAAQQELEDAERAAREATRARDAALRRAENAAAAVARLKNA